VLTRHGDVMLLTEFMRTRVLELAVHGLDLAAGVGHFEPGNNAKHGGFAAAGWAE